MTVEKTVRTEDSEDSKEAVLESIAIAYNEVMEARRAGRKLPSLESLIEELNDYHLQIGKRHSIA